MFSINNGVNAIGLEPTEFSIGQNYPNPFKDKTVIKYCVAYKTRIKITVFDAGEKLIEKLVDEEKNPGTYEVEFSACHSGEGRNLYDGYYYYRMEAGDYKGERKMIYKNIL